uniref:Myeloid associated differentiation marker n=1 Tax=Oncorhynchus kisutch TaxID=8019 RepID=A0A8C7MY12_ONCKI
MPLIVLLISQLLWVRVAALLISCVIFSVSAHGASLPGVGDWCVFCWAYSFTRTLLVLLMEHFGFQAQGPVSWNNFPITMACYATLLWTLCLHHLPRLLPQGPAEPQGGLNKRIFSKVFSCLTFMACIILMLVSDLVSYDQHTALQWCMAVYCIWFILSVGVVVLCVGECIGCLPFPFTRFLSAYGLLAVVIYLTATIICSVFQFDKLSNRPQTWQPPTLVTVDVLTALNFLLYLADLAYSAHLVFVSV